MNITATKKKILTKHNPASSIFTVYKQYLRNIFDITLHIQKEDKTVQSPAWLSLVINGSITISHRFIAEL